MNRMETIDPSRPLKNARHEAFAVEWAKGASAAEALRVAGYADEPANAKRMTQNDQIKARKEWIQRKAAKSAVLSIEEKREFLARVVRTPIGEVDETSDLCHSMEISDSGGRKYKMPDKIAAIKADNDLAGEGSEAKAADTLADFMRSVTTSGV